MDPVQTVLSARWQPHRQAVIMHSRHIRHRIQAADQLALPRLRSILLPVPMVLEQIMEHQIDKRQVVPLVHHNRPLMVVVSAKDPTVRILIYFP